MGLVDVVLNQVTGAVGGTSGQQNGLVRSVLGMLTSGQQGGIGGLVQTMEQQGLGAIAKSWVSTGQNLPISPDQVQRLFGNQKLQQFATEHGIDTTQIAAHLSKILPVAVDKLTPNGSIPTAPPLGDALKTPAGGGKLPGA